MTYHTLERSKRTNTLHQIIISTSIVGLIIFLYFFIVSNNEHPTVKQWKEKLNRVIKDPFLPEKEYKTDHINRLRLIIDSKRTSDRDEADKAAKSYPNLPIHYWLKTRKNHHNMYKDNSSCSPFPDLLELNINNVYWQTIQMTNATQVQVFSAYYDIRPVAKGPVVRIVSMTNRSYVNFPGKRTLYCQLWFENENQPVIAPMDKLQYMWFEFWHSHGDGTLGPYLLGCSIPDSHKNKIPQAVSFVEKPCDIAKNMVRVAYDEPKRLGEFSVCVKGMDFLQIDLSLRLIEWIELLFILGVDKIYFYQLEVHPNIRKVLDYYIKLGKVDAKDITLPSTHPNIPFIKHKFLLENNFYQCLDEIIPYNDCFYRNIYSHDYVVLIDIDEMIMPMRDNNWHDLIERTKKYAKPGTKFNSFTAQCMYYLDFMDKEYPHPNIPPFMHMSQHVYRAQNFTPQGYYVKTFFNTKETLSCHNHYPIATAGDSVGYGIHKEDARVHHYRRTCAWEVNCSNYDKNPVKDARIWDFKGLVPNVMKAVDDIGLLYL